jgi:hypothetical protein
MEQYASVTTRNIGKTFWLVSYVGTELRFERAFYAVKR